MPISKDPSSTSVAELVGRIADGLGRLVTDHVTLARLELVEDAKNFGGQLGKVLALLPFVLIGYTFLCAALAVALSRWLGLGWSLLAVGLGNVAGGGLGVWMAVTRMREKAMMASTLNDLQQSATALATVTEAKVEVARAGQ